jgi:hypothetical protein
MHDLLLEGREETSLLFAKKILTLLKVAINTVYIWMTNPSMPILSPDLHGFNCLLPPVQLLIHCTHANRTFACKPVSQGTATACLLTDNLRKYSVLDTLPFEKKAICWYRELLLNHNQADDMTGFDNGILIAYGMSPPYKLQIDHDQRPTHFMRGTANEVWGNDTHKVMYTIAADWTE